MVAAPRRIRPELTIVTAPSKGLFATVTLLFGACTALTVHWCAAMSPAEGVPMPGGWTVSMAWMRMPGQTWIGAAGSFLLMWIVMMGAMMLPSVSPMLWRYRRVLGAMGEPRSDRLTALAGAGYFFVWGVFGLCAFLAGAALVRTAMRWPAAARAVPRAAAVAIVLAGLIQLTAWKTRQLACCRENPGLAPGLAADAAGAWRYGTRLGRHCSSCCFGVTLSLLLIGVMDLRAMAAATAAITAERFASQRASRPVVRAIGALVVGVGLILMVRGLP
jgi:predicted metal-binding membrane protein